MNINLTYLCITYMFAFLRRKKTFYSFISREVKLISIKLSKYCPLALLKIIILKAILRNINYDGPGD